MKKTLLLIGGIFFAIFLSGIGLPSNWQVVYSPHVPATVFARITLNNNDSEISGTIAAFSQGICRGIAPINIYNHQSFCTLNVSLPSSSESVTFYVFEECDSLVYATEHTYNLDYGESLGSIHGLAIINIPLAGYIPAPLDFQIKITNGQASLTWQEVSNVDSYRIYFKTDIDEVWTLLDIVPSASLAYTDTRPLVQGFYYVTASFD